MAKRREFTPEQIAEMVAAYQRGGSYREIAQRVGYKQESVAALIRAQGVPKRPGRRLTLEPQAETIITEYAGGAPLTALAKQYAVDKQTIRKLLVAHGMEIRNQGKIPVADDVKEQVIALFEQGETDSNIARQVGLSQSWVSRFLLARGRPYRKAGGERHGMWNGGKIALGGYVMVLLPPDHPYRSMANTSGYVMEHRLVMAESLGRPLTNKETVHHIDGNKQNNDLSNLQLRRGRHGRGMIFRCADCGSYHIVEEEIN